MQQQQQGQGVPGNEDGEPPSTPSGQPGNDDTWGLGSASALDSLRRQNFRGRRSPNSEDRPTSE